MLAMALGATPLFIVRYLVKIQKMKHWTRLQNETSTLCHSIHSYNTRIALHNSMGDIIFITTYNKY